MTPLLTWVSALPWLLTLALVAWAVCTMRRNVGLVDIFWPLFIATAALAWLAQQQAPSQRGWLVLGLVALWALRLATHLGIRNWNAPEDHRYQAIRRRNEPGFVWKSLYLVFGLQALLALVVAAPVCDALTGTGRLGPIDVIGAALALAGIVIEALADAQLTRFRACPDNRGKVLDSGLWRYSRHPNYFGEFCVWWGLFLLALAAGGWWTAASPLLMSVLLLRVSGVRLLESDIGTRRPEYATYIARTNAFIPGPRKAA